MCARNPWLCVYFFGWAGKNGGKEPVFIFSGRIPWLLVISPDVFGIWFHVYLHLGAMQSAPCGSVCLVATGGYSVGSMVGQSV